MMAAAWVLPDATSADAQHRGGGTGSLPGKVVAEVWPLVAAPGAGGRGPGWPRPGRRLGPADWAKARKWREAGKSGRGRGRRPARGREHASLTSIWAGGQRSCPARRSGHRRPDRTARRWSGRSQKRRRARRQAAESARRRPRSAARPEQEQPAAPGARAGDTDGAARTRRTVRSRYAGEMPDVIQCTTLSTAWRAGPAGQRHGGRPVRRRGAAVGGLRAGAATTESSSTWPPKRQRAARRLAALPGLRTLPRLGRDRPTRPVSLGDARGAPVTPALRRRGRKGRATTHSPTHDGRAPGSPAEHHARPGRKEAGRAGRHPDPRRDPPAQGLGPGRDRGDDRQALGTARHPLGTGRRPAQGPAADLDHRQGSPRRAGRRDLRRARADHQPRTTAPSPTSSPGTGPSPKPNTGSGR